jgi:uncharacterized protein
VQNYPDIRKEMVRCGRAGRNSTAICDPDNQISFAARERVDAIAELTLKNTSSPCDPKRGFKVAFVLMSHIDDLSGCWYNKQCNAQKMTKGLHDRFGIGKRGCNDGVLFLLSIRDREMQISYGKATENHISQYVVNEILADIKHNLRRRDYDTAMIRAAELLYRVL